MNKKLIILCFLIVCCFVPSVKGIERIDEIYYFDQDTSQISIHWIYVEEGEVIYWSYKTYDSAFTVNFLIDGVMASYQKTNDRGSITVLSTAYNFNFWILRYGPVVHGYLHLIIENSQFFVYFAFSVVIIGIIGTIVIIWKILKQK